MGGAKVITVGRGGVRAELCLVVRKVEFSAAGFCRANLGFRLTTRLVTV